MLTTLGGRLDVCLSTINTNLPTDKNGYPRYVMKVFFDGELATRLRSPSIDHPTKAKFGFAVRGAQIEFDDLKATSVP